MKGRGSRSALVPRHVIDNATSNRPVHHRPALNLKPTAPSATTGVGSEPIQHSAHGVLGARSLARFLTNLGRSNWGHQTPRPSGAPPIAWRTSGSTDKFILVLAMRGRPADGGSQGLAVKCALPHLSQVTWSHPIWPSGQPPPATPRVTQTHETRTERVSHVIRSVGCREKAVNLGSGAHNFTSHVAACEWFNASRSFRSFDAVHFCGNRPCASV
jgi:hypothetical protein